MAAKPEAETIIHGHVMWAMGAGLLPLPLVDLAAVTAIQIDMLRQLAALHGVDYRESSGKTFVSALAGSTLARIGASFIKSLPGLGTVLGGVSMSIMSGASTYAVGTVAAAHLARGGDFATIDFSSAKRAYQDAYERGKSFVSDLEREKKDAARKMNEQLEALTKLHEQGVIDDEELERKKQQILERAGK